MKIQIILSFDFCLTIKHFYLLQTLDLTHSTKYTEHVN